MVKPLFVALSVLALTFVVMSFAQTPPAPSSLLKERTTDIPKVREHEARMVAAELPPNTAGRWHTHPAPVFIYVIDGSLVYEIEGREPREYKAGMAFIGQRSRAVRVGN